MMTPFSYLSLLPLVVLLLVSLVTPLISALLTKAPTAVTGLVTLAITTATGFLTEWGNAGDHYNWHRGLFNALLAFLTAALAHAKIWAGSGVERHAYAAGNTAATPPPAAP